MTPIAKCQQSQHLEEPGLWSVSRPEGCNLGLCRLWSQGNRIEAAWPRKNMCEVRAVPDPPARATRIAFNGPTDLPHPDGFLVSLYCQMPPGGPAAAGRRHPPLPVKIVGSGVARVRRKLPRLYASA